MQSPQTWVLALVAACIVVGGAYRLRALAPSGAIAAIALGLVVVGCGGWWAGVILVVFFASSSSISVVSRGGEHEQARGSRRDWVQVLANGWGLLLGCVLFGLTQWSPWLMFGVGAIAAATADTWSSEIGRTSTTPPRLITTMKVVPAGTSGAVSTRGSLAAIAGALLIALLAAVGSAADLMPVDTGWTMIIIGIAIAGVSGGLVDSILGATLQEKRWCDTCEIPTESNPHRCGQPTRQIGGIRGFDNDVVNAFCVLSGAMLGILSGIL